MSNNNIWKFVIPRDRDNVYGDFPVEMPKGAAVLTVHEQGGQLCVWAEVDDKIAARETQVFCVRGTGHGIDGTEGMFLGTAFQGPFVWHVYVRQPV